MIGQDVAHHDVLPVNVDIGILPGHRLGVLGFQGQLAVVAQHHRVVGVAGIVGALGVSHESGGAGAVFALFVVAFAAGQVIGGIDALLDVPVAIVVLHHRCIGRSLHMDVVHTLGHILVYAVFQRGVAPVVDFPGVVIFVAVAGNRACPVIGNVLTVFLDIDQGILLVSIEAVVHGGIKGGLGHCPVAAEECFAAIPVVGIESIGAGFGIVVGFGAVLSLLIPVSGVRTDDAIDIEGIDVAAQTHFVNHTAGILPGYLRRIDGLAVNSLFGHEHFLNAEQAGRDADDHGLLVRCHQRALHPNHEVHIVVILSVACRPYEIVGSAHAVRIVRNLTGFGLCLDVLHGVVVRKAHIADLLGFIHRAFASAPPDDAVVEVISIFIVSLVFGFYRLAEERIHVHRCANQLAALLQRGAHGILERIGLRQRVPLAQLLRSHGAAVQRPVCQDAMDAFDFHVLAHGIGEGHIAGEVIAVGRIHLSRSGQCLLLDLGDDAGKSIGQGGIAAGGVVAVVIGDATAFVVALAHVAHHIFSGSGDGASLDCVVVAVIDPNLKARCRRFGVVFPVGLPAIGGRRIPTISAVAVIPIAVIAGLGIGAGGEGGRIHGDLCQCLLIAIQLIQFHRHGVDVAAMALVGIVAVVVLGDLTLVVSCGQRRNEAVAFVSAAAGATVAVIGRRRIPGGGGIAPFVRYHVSRCAVGQDHQEGHPGHSCSVFISDRGVLSIQQHGAAQRNTGMEVGAAILAVPGRADTTVCVPATNIFAVVASRAAIAFLPG